MANDSANKAPFGVATHRTTRRSRAPTNRTISTSQQHPAGPLLFSVMVCVLLLLVVRITTTHQSGGEVITASKIQLGTSVNDNKPSSRVVRQKFQRPQQADLRWPGRQLNVLVDKKSLNDTEKSMLANVFQQLEHRTCIHVHKLSPDLVNPFAVHNMQLNDTERNFIYIFKSPTRNGEISGRHPTMGLSSLGCVKQGRQSLVLTDLTFKWPELVLRYHIMRSLGVDKLERPDGHVRKLLNMLPLNQKIGGSEHFEGETSQTKPLLESGAGGEPYDFWSPADFEQPAHIAYASKTTSSMPSESSIISVQQSERSQTGNVKSTNAYLSEDDLVKIKELYDCKDYQNRLSPMLLDDQIEQSAEPKAGQLTNDQIQKSDQQLEALSSELVPKKSKLSEENDGKQADKLSDSALNHQSTNLMDEKSSHELQDAIEATKKIIESLLGADEQLNKSMELTNSSAFSTQTEQINPTNSGCKPLESCPLNIDQNNNLHSGGPLDANGEIIHKHQQHQEERPMILRLDDFHAQDPQLKQADQMKLSQLSNDTLETYRLMNNPTNLNDFLLQPPPTSVDHHGKWQPDDGQSGNNWQKPKSEMLISFEQSNNQLKDPVSSLASSQVLKLCSCTCQTMTPKLPPLLPPQPQPTPPPYTPRPTPAPVVTPMPITDPSEPSPPHTPTPAPHPTLRPTFPTDPGPNCTGEDYDDDENGCHSPTPAPNATELPPVTILPSPLPPTPKPTEAPTEAPTTQPPTTTTTSTTTTTTTTEPHPTIAPEITEGPTKATSIGDSTGQPNTTNSSDGSLFSANACDQVEWVKPNKTVYASARIVWDVDRANQNYFLCNNQLNDELIPGKTHGFYCKISQEGKAFETHNFNVLTKPEHVNLAWVQKNSNSFGRTNFPVVGGYSKQKDPYIVSRCLVKDENNDIIPLIGYINNQGVGWFPFDDIQIECSQYDVLACVN